jgi:hypothetical protein
MPLDPKQLESFARGPKPGEAELDPELSSAIDDEHEETLETDADDTAAFEGALGDFVHALEANAEDIDELALELTDDQLDAPTEDPSDEDRATIMRHVEDGDIDGELLRFAKEALPDLDLDTAEKIGEHLATEGMVQDPAPVVAYLLVLAAEIDNIEPPEAEEGDDAEEDLEDDNDEPDAGDEAGGEEMPA